MVRLALVLDTELSKADFWRLNFHFSAVRQTTQTMPFLKKCLNLIITHFWVITTLALKSCSIIYNSKIFNQNIKASIRSQVQTTSFKKMKISALVSVIAAGRQARDAQALFNKMLGDHNNNVEQRNFVFSETDSLYQILQLYSMGISIPIKGKVL